MPDVVSAHTDYARSAHEAVIDRYPSMRCFRGWKESDDYFSIPGVIPEKAQQYYNLVRDLQGDPSICEEWYKQITGTHLPPEIQNFIARSIATTLRFSDASTIELASMQPIDELTLPRILRYTGDLSEHPPCYLDIIEEMNLILDEDNFEIGQRDEVGQNIVTRESQRRMSWPFYPGFPTSELESLYALTVQSFLGAHPLLCADPKGELLFYDGLQNRSAVRALQHDDDHLSEQGNFLMRRALAVLKALDFPNEDIHRNFIIPVALVDIFFKRLFLDSVELHRGILTPLQNKVLEAYLFASHEEQHRILPPALWVPNADIAANSVTNHDRIQMMRSFINRWSDPHDMRLHFGDAVDNITREDHFAALTTIAHATASAIIRLKNTRELSGKPFHPKICTLLEIFTPLYLSTVATVTPHHNWRKMLNETLNELNLGHSETAKSDR